MSIYVQHKSGQGDIWEVYPIPMDMKGWSVRAYLTSTNYNEYRLPKSEYIEVPKPEAWEDVTKQCDFVGNLLMFEQTEILGKRDVATIRGNYRLKKVKGYDVLPGGWAFVVERKQP